nr:hypothetical protein [Tanacetum cinerariifolium]
IDAKPSTNNEDKVSNPGILIQENPFEIITRVVQDKKLAISNASLVIEDVDPPLYELPLFKEVPREKVFNPSILTSKGVHTFLLLKLSHQGLKAFKVIKIFKSLMEIFPCSYGEDIRILDVLCLYFYSL